MFALIPGLTAMMLSRLQGWRVRRAKRPGRMARPIHREVRFLAIRRASPEGRTYATAAIYRCQRTHFTL